MKKKRFILILLSSFFLSYCVNNEKPKKDYNLILKEAIGHRNVNTVYILTSSHCMGCNKIFANYVENLKKEDDYLIIVNADKTRLDLSPFQDLDNVIYNFHRQDTFFNSSKIIYMKNRKIERIVPINVETVRFLGKPDFLNEFSYKLK